MAEVGIDISGRTPKVLTTGAVQASDVVITMGRGDAPRSSPASATSTGTWKTPQAGESKQSDPSGTRSKPEYRRS